MHGLAYTRASTETRSDIVAAQTKVGFTGSVEFGQPSPEVCEELKLTSGIIEEIARVLPRAMEETDHLFRAAA